MAVDGTAYVIEQLGQALKASHEVIAQQAAQIAQLEAERDKREAQ